MLVHISIHTQGPTPHTHPVQSPISSSITYSKLQVLYKICQGSVQLTMTELWLPFCVAFCCSLLEKVKTENFTFVLVSTSCSGKFNKCRWLAGAVEAQRGDYMKGAGRVIDVDLHSSARSCILLSTEEQHQLAKAYPVTPQKARSKTMQGGA